MSIQKSIRCSLFATMTLAVAGVAFAAPPMRGSSGGTPRASTSGEASARPGAGYRDAFGRFGGRSEAAQAERLSPGPGYRDVLARFGGRSEKARFRSMAVAKQRLRGESR
jgi:hypothetical protein